MKIQPITQQNRKTRYHNKQKQISYPVFKAINVLEIADKYKNMENTLKKETKKFADYGNNVKLLGKGLFSEVFGFSNLNNIVIKRPFAYDTLEQEMNALKAVPEILTGTQKFVARTYDDVRDKYYLLSTKVKGDSPNPGSNSWNSYSLRNLFDGMYEMDKAGLYHGDLNNGNIKIDNYNNVNFLDFQWGSVVPSIRFFENNPTQCIPDFMYVQNAQMFEMAEVPYYLKSVPLTYEGKRFMREYLEKKSRYHQARINYVENITSNWPYSSEKPKINAGLDFERAQANVYKSPDENTIKLETLKIQFLSAFREASKYLDPNTPHKNILAAPSSYLVALSHIQSLRREISKQSDSWNNSYKQEYLNGLKKYADYWYNNLTEWTENAFYYPYRHSRNKLLERETLHNFYDSEINIEYFKPITDIATKVDYSYSPEYRYNYSIKTDETKSKMDDIKYYYENRTSLNYDVRKAYEKLKDAYNNDRGLDVINAGLLLTRRAYEAYKDSYDYHYDYIIKYASELSESVFKTIFDEIKKYGPEYSFMCGYDRMNEFK